MWKRLKQDWFFAKSILAIIVMSTFMLVAAVLFLGLALGYPILRLAEVLSGYDGTGGMMDSLIVKLNELQGKL